METESQLELSDIIGFNGKVCNGLIYHPDKKHLIYPISSIIVVKHI